jgi:hypothetical protein
MKGLSSLVAVAQEVKRSGERATVLRYTYLAYLIFIGIKIKRNI